MGEMTLAEALVEVQKFGRIVQGFERAQETATALAGAEQLLVERAAQADALAARIESLRPTLAELQASIEAAKLAADRILEDAKVRATGLLDDAASHNATKAAEAEAELAAKQAEIDAAEASLADLTAKIEAAQADLNAIDARRAAALEAARAAFGS